MTYVGLGGVRTLISNIRFEGESIYREMTRRYVATANSIGQYGIIAIGVYIVA